MEIKIFDREFVERTKKIIEQSSSAESEYEVTLLINCMLALVSLPTERTSNTSRCDSFRKAIVEELRRMNVIQKESSEHQTFRAIKNALSHMHIEVKNKHGLISEVIFWDKHPDAAQYHTVLKFSPLQMKEFALFVANKHLERLSAKKRK